MKAFCWSGLTFSKRINILMKISIFWRFSSKSGWFTRALVVPYHVLWAGKVAKNMFLTFWGRQTPWEHDRSDLRWYEGDINSIYKISQKSTKTTNPKMMGLYHSVTMRYLRMPVRIPLLKKIELWTKISPRWKRFSQNPWNPEATLVWKLQIRKDFG